MTQNNPESDCPDCPCCRDRLEGLFDYIEGELCGEDADRVRAHLDECESCRRFINELGCIFETCRHAAVGAEVDPSVIDRIKARLRSKCKPCE